VWKFNKQDQDYTRENLLPEGLEHWKFKEYYKGLNHKPTNGFGTEKSLLGKRSYSTGVNLSPPQAIKIYKNAEIEKPQMIKENRGKSGVYRWRCLVNGKCYIGSSSNLSRRLTEYYNVNKLIKYSNMIINVALLKYGYSSFELEILEYCTAENVISRWAPPQILYWSIKTRVQYFKKSWFFTWIQTLSRDNSRQI
jgi:predicted GIY-YIG superfamily endonuclease